MNGIHKFGFLQNKNVEFGFEMKYMRLSAMELMDLVYSSGKFSHRFL